VLPTAIGVTTPVTASIVAVPASVVAHEPPLTEFVSVVVEPMHIAEAPPIVAGEGLTETVTGTEAVP
jgi:hypothetical protein